MKTPGRAAAILAALAAAGCGRSEPPGPPDWDRIEAWLGSEKREERTRGLMSLFRADQERPGTLAELARMPEAGLPGVRHYTAVSLLLSLRGTPRASREHRAWTPARGTLELLVAGLGDDRPLPIGGTAYWDLLPVATLCLTALETFTGTDPPPRPVNLLPPRGTVGEWRRWWESGHDHLVYDAERGIWHVDSSARRLGIRLATP